MKPLIGVGGPASRAADTEEALIARLSTLAPALDGEPDPEWQSRTRSRLVAMAAVRTPEPEPVPPLRRLLARREGPLSAWRVRLTAGLAGAAAAVTALATAVTLSADAKPGDALYGLKRGTEQTQLALAGDARGRTLLGFASTRLEELSAVLADDPPAGLVEDTLATMDAQAADGAAWLAGRAVDTGSSAPLDELAGWSAGQSAGLDGLRSDVPGDARDDADSSAGLLDRIDERVEALRASLDCPSGPATDGSDELGPVPGACAASPAPPVDGGGEPGAPAPGLPGTTAGPTPGGPGGGTTAPGGGTGSGGSEGSGGGSTGEPGTDGGQPGLPGDDPAPPEVSGTPDLPGLPDLPKLPETDLPTLFPGPDGDVRPPAGASPGSTPTSPVPGTGPLPDVPDLDLCVEPLPVIGGC